MCSWNTLVIYWFLIHFVLCLQPVARADREVIARIGNCVLALAKHKMMLFDTSILYTYEASLKFPVSVCRCVSQHFPVLSYCHVTCNTKSVCCSIKLDCVCSITCVLLL